MTSFEKLEAISLQNDGVLQTREVVASGISKTMLQNYVMKQGYERISHGIYLSPNAWKDSLYLLSLRCKQAVFSHETALFLHDLTDREPLQYAVTVKTGYNPSYLTADSIKVYSVKKDLHDLGLTTAITPISHTVPVYNMERTICDIVRSRSSIEMQSFQDAIKQYVRRKDKNLSELMTYAKLFHVDKILRPYLEVLL